MNVTLIAERYAKALFEIALEKNALEEVFRDVVRLSALIRECRPLKLFLRAPIINPGKKRIVMDEILKDFNPVTIAFINLLVAKRREATIPEIVTQFIEQYNQYKNIIILRVKTAVPLEKELRGQISSVMAGYTKAHIEIIEEVDDTVIGGFVLTWDDKQYDASILKQIERMKKGLARINLYVKGIEHGRH
ncbi:MAG: ATP synthase F1 subunit delta [Bacteroidetes bacterium]|nr:ATP synthase F1 subunit delta [Bacteroidota bacterium]